MSNITIDKEMIKAAVKEIIAEDPQIIKQAIKEIINDQSDEEKTLFEQLNQKNFKRYDKTFKALA